MSTCLCHTILPNYMSHFPQSFSILWISHKPNLISNIILLLAERIMSSVLLRYFLSILLDLNYRFLLLKNTTFVILHTFRKIRIFLDIVNSNRIIGIIYFGFYRRGLPNRKLTRCLLSIICWRPRYVISFLDDMFKTISLVNFSLFL